jgi:hypothetical protein
MLELAIKSFFMAAFPYMLLHPVCEYGVVLIKLCRLFIVSSSAVRFSAQLLTSRVDFQP